MFRSFRVIGLSNSRHQCAAALPGYGWITRRCCSATSTTDKVPVVATSAPSTQGLSLAELHPELAARWDRDRNGSLRPEDVRPSSMRLVWWQGESPKESKNSSSAGAPSFLRPIAACVVDSTSPSAAWRAYIAARSIEAPRSATDRRPPDGTCTVTNNTAGDAVASNKTIEASWLPRDELLSLWRPAVAAAAASGSSSGAHRESLHFAQSDRTAALIRHASMAEFAFRRSMRKKARSSAHDVKTPAPHLEKEPTTGLSGSDRPEVVGPPAREQPQKVVEPAKAPPVVSEEAPPSPPPRVILKMRARSTTTATQAPSVPAVEASAPPSATPAANTSPAAVGSQVEAAPEVGDVSGGTKRRKVLRVGRAATH